MSATMEAELEEVFAELRPQEQREVLDYARALRDGDWNDDPEPEMLHLVGSISREELRQMREALEGDGFAGLIMVRFLGSLPEAELEGVRETPEEERAAGPGEARGELSAAAA